jgi:DNA-binding NarL/FixJ family response regulator
MTSSGRPIRILAVDDHAVLREGIAALIRNQSDLELVAEAATGAEALELFRIHRPDVTLVDLGLPDMNGVELISRIRAESSRARIVVLTTFRGDVQALRSLKAGATGYLLKSSVRKELVETIRAVHSGLKRIPPEIATEIATHASEDELSEREIEVLQCVAAGSSNKIVASTLQISEDTVKNHMRNILSKLGANDRTHAVTIATRRGFLDFERS